jgi:hypothetical protein
MVHGFHHSLRRAAVLPQCRAQRVPWNVMPSFDRSLQVDEAGLRLTSVDASGGEFTFDQVGDHIRDGPPRTGTGRRPCGVVEAGEEPEQRAALLGHHRDGFPHRPKDSPVAVSSCS